MPLRASSLATRDLAEPGHLEHPRKEGSMRNRLRILAWSLALAGCNDPPSGPLDVPEFRVPAEAVWSGGSTIIVSDYFVGRSIPAIHLDTNSLTVIRVDDSTVSLALPSLPSGTYPLFIESLDLPGPVGQVELVGFRDRSIVSPGFLWEPLVVSAGDGSPKVVAALPTQPPQGAIAIVDLRTSLSTTVTGVRPPRMDRGVGGSFQPGHLILQDSTGALGDWHLFLTLTHTDTVPDDVIFSRQIARLADQVWLFTSNHLTTVRRPGLADTTIDQEDPFGFAFSLAADRALLNSGATANGGPPVFRPTTGEVVYRLPTDVVGAAFSGDGTRLYFASYEGSLSVVDATTGALLQQVTYPLPGGTNHSRLAGIGLDPGSGTLFLGAIVDDSIPEVQVYDAATLQMIGRLTAPLGALCPFQPACFARVPSGSALAVDGQGGTVFLIVHGEPAAIWEFDLMQ